MEWDMIGTVAGIVAAIVSAIVGMATAHLRMFTRNEMNEATNEILKHIDEKYATKELTAHQMEDIERRILQIENRSPARQPR